MAVGLSIVLAALWLLVHNSGGGFFRSGYGYDALEYLVIGRSLNDGFPFYTFVPSKSWALYYLVAAYLRLPGGDTHAGIAALVVALLALIAGASYVVMRKVFGGRTAVVSSVLVIAAAIFMELIYLEPEGLVFLLGLGAYVVVARSPFRESARGFFAAGLLIGGAMAFKSVAGFYLLGMIGWIVLARPEATGQRWPKRQQSVRLCLGALVSLIAPFIYFWLTGRLQPYLQWSYIFPFAHYPANTIWLRATATKLLWVMLMIAAAFALSTHRGLKRALYSDARVVLLLWLGIAGLMPLLKTQASHYAFPGAAFLLLFAAVVFSRWSELRGLSLNAFGVLVMLVVGAVGIVGAVAVRADALPRLLPLASFEEETGVSSVVQRLVPPEKRAIFLTRGTSLYWISHRYPSWPVLNADVQTTYLVETHGRELLKALDDPALALVEFDPAARLIGDDRLKDSPAGREFLTTLECKLVEAFERRDDLLPGFVLWLPRATSRTVSVC